MDSKLIRAIRVLMGYRAKNGSKNVPMKAVAVATGFTETEVGIILNGIDGILRNLQSGQA